MDTCLSALTLALRKDDGEVFSVSKELGIGHAEHIAPSFSALLTEAGIEAQTIRRIGVTTGPGSFMGQRVGIAFAKGLALGTGAETVGFTTLEALAEGAASPCLALVDARRGQVYAQLFPNQIKPALIPYEEAKALLDQTSSAIGSGVTVVDPARTSDRPLVPRPKALLALTERGSPAPLRTLYLRAPDAKPPSRPAL